MFSTLHNHTVATALALLAITVPCIGQENIDSATKLQDLIVDLRKNNLALQRSLIEANKSERDATEQLKQVRERLEALGKNLLDGGDDRLIHAVADIQLANERLHELDSASARLSSSVTEFLRSTVSSDPDARLQVEIAMRELDSISGLRQKPRPDIRTGHLKQAQIVSLDQDSGMLVLNLGESQGATIGMTFYLMRGQQTYGKAILSDVRRAVSGAFVEHLDTNDFNPRLGDTAVLLTQN